MRCKAGNGNSSVDVDEDLWIKASFTPIEVTAVLMLKSSCYLVEIVSFVRDCCPQPLTDARMVEGARL